INVADLGRDGEPGRHGETCIGHLGEAGAFAAEEVLHGAVAVGFPVCEEVHILPGFGIRDSGFGSWDSGFAAGARARSFRHSIDSVEQCTQELSTAEDAADAEGLYLSIVDLPFV